MRPLVHRPFRGGQVDDREPRGGRSPARLHTYLLDGDNVRHGLNKNLGFTAADRVENIRRVGEVAKLFVDAGLIVLCSFISPFRAERAGVRDLVGTESSSRSSSRAARCLRAAATRRASTPRAAPGELPNFTGIDSPYEAPENPISCLTRPRLRRPSLLGVSSICSRRAG